MNHTRATKILPRVLFSSMGHHVLTERGHNLGYSSRRERGRERRETSITIWVGIRRIIFTILILNFSKGYEFKSFIVYAIGF
jgi:hypothetical protein